MKLLNKLLCRMGFHDFQFISKWEPSKVARIVTKVTYTSLCSRCNLKIEDVHEYDRITGAPIK